MRYQNRNQLRNAIAYLVYIFWICIVGLDVVIIVGTIFLLVKLKAL